LRGRALVAGNRWHHRSAAFEVPSLVREVVRELRRRKPDIASLAYSTPRYPIGTESAL
jgi:hypothetical protein